MHGTYWLRPNQLLAGPYPHEVETILGLGVTCFVDLTEAGELKPYLLPDHVQHHRLSIPDYSTPTPDHVRRILDTIDAALVEGHVVYVHCWGGIGRTGTIMGCYLVRHGMVGDAALETISRLRGRCSPETEEQFNLVRNWSG